MSRPGTRTTAPLTRHVLAIAESGAEGDGTKTIAHDDRMFVMACLGTKVGGICETAEPLYDADVAQSGGDLCGSPDRPSDSVAIANASTAVTLCLIPRRRRSSGTSPIPTSCGHRPGYHCDHELLGR